ncbi:1,4-alpha-glucan branching protein GlgB [Thermodesulfobacteriota bacterium]
MADPDKYLTENRSLLTEDDIYLFNEGSNFRLYEKLGSHPTADGSERGTFFGVWAPDAGRVYVAGDFNGWSRNRHPLFPLGQSGIWSGYIHNVGRGSKYKYIIESRYNGYSVEKADPFAIFSEIPPKTASVVWDLQYQWHDNDWMEKRKSINLMHSPMSIYELHLGSWMRLPEQGNRFLTYREIAPRLAEYVKKMGFTHVEFLPVMEHPFYGSWGYQSLGYFAPTSRYGEPEDFMYLVDIMHQNDIGVILDWVPSHFPNDEYGLSYFDGTHLFEHADPKKGEHPDWKSLIFNYGRNEVVSFLISSAIFWLDQYHADGFRIDAVASMLYLDYGHKDGDWIPNEYGGNEDLEAVSLIKRLNKEIYKCFPGVHTIAEESTSWPMVSRPTYLGGLGFGMKWDMGWMHDTLEYMSMDPIHRKYNHDKLTFRMIYGYTENFVLPLSHDEIVYGKGSLLQKMPGDEWQQFANLRLLFGYMYAQPGKKLIFMGGEFGQRNEWYHESSLDWHLLENPLHEGIQKWVRDLNNLYMKETGLHELDFESSGFQWLDCNDSQQSTLSMLRLSRDEGESLIVVCNFTPVPRYNFKIGLSHNGVYKELLNSDAEYYGGSGIGNLGEVYTKELPYQGRPFSVEISLPPLAVVFLKLEV